MYPVTMEGAYLKLEKEYLKMVNDGGEKLLITCYGKIIEKNRVEGSGSRKFLLVKKLISTFPGVKCD